MAIQDVDDMIKQLRRHPEWRDALRREILTEELLSLPQIVRELVEFQRRHYEEFVYFRAETERRFQELAEAQQRTEQRVGELAEAQQRTEQRVGELAEAQQRTEQRVGELAEAQQRTEQRVGELAEAQLRTEQRVEELAIQVGELTGAVRVLEGRVGSLDGRLFEREYIDKVYAYFDDLLRKIRVVSWSEVASLLDQAEERISRRERKQVMEADLIIQGRRLADKEETYLLGEVSVGIGLEDVHRAAQRAKILSRATEQPVIPAVGGKSIIPEAQELAQELGVAVILDGGLQIA